MRCVEVTVEIDPRPCCFLSLFCLIVSFVILQPLESECHRITEYSADQLETPTLSNIIYRAETGIRTFPAEQYLTRDQKAVLPYFRRRCRYRFELILN